MNFRQEISGKRGLVVLRDDGSLVWPDLSLIQNRVREVQAAINRHQLAVDELQGELRELELAARVLTRLSGASGDQAGAEDASGSKATGGVGKPEGAPSMPDMIREIMGHGLKAATGWEPREVADEVRKRWWPDVSGSYVSSIMWRMAKRGDLEKEPNSPLYRVPRKNEAADEQSLGDTSAASATHAEGREAGPGGGT